MKQELIDVYDKNRNKIGKTIKREENDTLGDGEYYIVVHCFIINSAKKILMTQRNQNQNRGGKWEETHGGVQSGETSLEAMKRELKEELGLSIDEKELKLVKTNITGNAIRDIYVLSKDIKTNEIDFNDNEVRDCKYVTLDELKEMIEKNECSFTKFEHTIFYNSDIDNLR